LIRLNSVDFPAPFGPMIACRSPAGTVRLTPRMIRVAPKLLCTSLSLMAGAVISPSPRPAPRRAHCARRRPRSARCGGTAGTRRPRAPPFPATVEREVEDGDRRSLGSLDAEMVAHLDDDDEAGDQ